MKALVGVGHDFKPRPNCISHSRQPGHIFADVGSANFDFGAFEAVSFCFEGLLDQHLGGQLQPAALCGVKRHPALGTAQQLPQRQSLALSSPIPQRSVNAGQRQAGHGTHCRSMRVKKQIFPNGFNVNRIFAQQPRHQMVFEQGHHRATARTNGVGIACSLDAIAANQSEQDGFLGDKGLNSVGALNLRRQVDLTQVNAIDGD